MSTSLPTLRSRYHATNRALLAAQLIATLVALAVELFWSGNGQFFYAVSIVFPLFGMLAGFMDLPDVALVTPDEALIDSVGQTRGFSLRNSKSFREVKLTKIKYRLAFFGLSAAGYGIRWAFLYLVA